MIGFEHVTNSVVGVLVEPYTLRVLTSSAARTVSGRLPTATPSTSPIDQTSPAKHRRRNVTVENRCVVVARPPRGDGTVVGPR